MDAETARRSFLERFNQERAAAGSPPLRSDESLNRVAQESAEQLRENKGAPFEDASFREIRLRLARAGYEAHGWSQSFAASPGDVGEVFSWWKTSNEDAYLRMLDGDYQDLGIGVSELDGTPLYTFILGWRESEFFARQTAGLADLAKVRGAMLARVNVERAAAGAPPLGLHPLLNAAAQGHAEDMLSRSYYRHESPEGLSPRNRVEAQGYSAELVGENISRGPLSVDEAVDGWMRSTEHRSNLLHPRFTELGIGLAVGNRTALWVQSFGRPR
jgi:uncharacterized protein YkwD